MTLVCPSLSTRASTTLAEPPPVPSNVKPGKYSACACAANTSRTPATTALLMVLENPSRMTCSPRALDCTAGARTDEAPRVDRGSRWLAVPCLSIPPWVADIIVRVATTPDSRIAELTPRDWKKGPRSELRNHGQGRSRGDGVGRQFTARPRRLHSHARSADFSGRNGLANQGSPAGK